MVGASLTEIVHPGDLFRFQALCESGSHEGQDIRLRHANGTWLSCEARGTNLRNHREVRGVVLNIRDVSERKNLEDELRHQAFHDSLTGLANGALFRDRVEHALARQRRTGGPLAVLLVDLDDFKTINDSLGHDGGDHVLCQVASRLRSAVRSSDTVARLGGDEFAILLEDSARGNGPSRAAERALARLAPPVRVNGRSLIVSASIGAAIANKGRPGGEELLRNADVAMYAAKAQGKGRWAQFEPGMNVAVAERLELRADLVDALTAGNQMELYYQPVVDLETRKVSVVEALLRWHHPKRGMVPPLEFLPLAEECGLIVPLGRWVLRQALTQVAAWRRESPVLADLAVSVNVSGRQLEDPGFASEVRDALTASGLDDPSALILEITETTLMREAEETITRLSELKALGTRLAIDDFGTGYSSLGYLQHFPVDLLKIDRSFVAGLAGGPRQAALAEAVVKIGASLELQTVAEGVEMEEQVGQLRALACGYGQGFLFAEPLPAQGFQAQFAGQSTMAPAMAITLP
jgi:diguanylate cyclase (GGDEF)-like protein